MYSRIKTLDQAYKNFVSALLKIYDEPEAGSIANLVFEDMLGYDSIKRIMNANELLPASLFETLDLILYQLLDHKPLQYIIGKAHFYGLIFRVNESVLIPRPETEELVDWVIQSVKDIKSLSVLDIGTGSGCIAISLAKNLPRAFVSAIDISQKALQIAKKNADENKVPVLFEEKNILNEPLSETYDVIISNPPYVLQSEQAGMRKNVLSYEPHAALFVYDNDDLLFYRKIAGLGLKNLNDQGYLFFEINEQRGLQVVALLKQMGYSEIELRKDMRNKDRMVRARKILKG